MVLVINIKTEDEQFLAQTSSRFQNPMTEFQEWKWNTIIKSGEKLSSLSRLLILLKEK